MKQIKTGNNVGPGSIFGRPDRSAVPLFDRLIRRIAWSLRRFAGPLPTTTTTTTTDQKMMKNVAPNSAPEAA